MPFSAGPNIAARPNLVFEYDTGDVKNSYIGEPTTNVMRQSNNVTGTQYGYNDEYSTSQLVKTWTPNLITPIGTGATLLSEQSAGSSFYYCLNWFDDSEDGKRCLSAFIYPLSSGITNFTIGMVADPSNSVVFNLDTGATTVGAGLSSANAFYTPVPGAPGWYRIGANIEGRVGGWVAGIGFGLSTGYTPSAPFKSLYICGIQYERNIANHCTQFTEAQTTRSATQGLLDVSGRGTLISLSNVSFTSTAQMTFDGTDDQINMDSYASVVPYGGSITVESLVQFNAFAPNDVVVAYGGNGTNKGFLLQYEFTSGLSFSVFNISVGGTAGIGTAASAAYVGKYTHMVGVYNQSQVILYLNGVNVASANYTGGLPQDTTFRIGNEFARSYYSNMNLPVVRIYNSALSAQEVLQNYNQLKGRFNLQ